MNLANLKSASIRLFYIIAVFLLLINFLALKSAILGLILGLFWVIYTSNTLGKTIFPGKPSIYQNLLGFFILQIIIILLSCLCFYLYKFSDLVIIFIFLIISAATIFVRRHHSRESGNSEITASNLKLSKNKVITLTLFISYIILYIISLYLLFTHATAASIRSPWEILPKSFFILYFILTSILLIIILIKNNKKIITSYWLLVTGYNSGILPLILISMHTFLTLIIAVVIYKIGYGFDPLVHRASETALSQLGYILPKPLYYLGQYTLVVFWSKILFLKVSLIDKLLVPLLASLLLPTTIYYSLKNFLKNNRLILIITCYLLLVTGYLFYTVPQSLANLFLIIFVFLAFPLSFRPKSLNGRAEESLDHEFSKYNILSLFLIAMAILLIHPLAGIPAFIYLGFKFLNQYNIKKVFKIIYFSLASISIPAFFSLASLLSNNFNIKFSISNLKSIPSILTLPQYLSFYSIYHLIYLYKFNLIIIFILIFIAGVYCIKKLQVTSYKLLITIGTITILIINTIFLACINFESIISYEQSEYPRRLLQILILFSLPIILPGLYFISQKIIQFKKGKFILIIASAFIITIQLYLSYPHVDTFEKTRGYSVSQADIEAVRWINKDAGKSDYIVLANQSTSAAALQEFGFYKYHQIKTQNSINKTQDLFYYPIPTSSPLYDIYLKLVYNPPQMEYINETRQLTGVNTVYFVINDYWLDSKKRIQQAAEISTDIKNIDNKIWIFKFE